MRHWDNLHNCPNSNTTSARRCRKSCKISGYGVRPRLPRLSARRPVRLCKDRLRRRPSHL